MELTVWAHDGDDSEVYVEPALLNSQEGDIAELWQPASETFRDKSGLAALSRSNSTNHGQGRKRAGTKTSVGSRSSGPASTPASQKKNYYFRIRRPKPGSSALPAISVSSKVLQTLGIRPRSQIQVRVLPAHKVKKTELDVVELHFRGVYLTRSDHYRIGKSMHGSCVHTGQRITYLHESVGLNVETLFKGGQKKFSGYIGEDTRLIFRSDSARILIFIHMSAEMWNFDETGDIMFHRLINSFIPEMLHKWHTQGDSHLVSLVLFTSVSENALYPSKLSDWMQHEDGSASGGLSGGKRYLESGMLERDTRHFYRVVVDSAHISRWSDIMQTLRVEFERFPREVLEDPETHEMRGYFLPSTKSNILEALSLATTLLTSKFVDRDLCRTGVQAMVATAGQACFDVDLSDLWSLSRRLLGVEIGVELVCLARPPLHVTPMFRALLANESETRHVEPYRLAFVVPKWINMSFWTSPDRYRKQWIPRCRIYDLQMIGLIENEARTLGLKSFDFEPDALSSHAMRRFDAGVFKSVEQIATQRRIERTAKVSDSAQLRPHHDPARVAALAITTKAVASAASRESPGTAASNDDNHAAALFGPPSASITPSITPSIAPTVTPSLVSSGTPSITPNSAPRSAPRTPRSDAVTAASALGALLGPKPRETRSLLGLLRNKPSIASLRTSPAAPPSSPATSFPPPPAAAQPAPPPVVVSAARNELPRLEAPIFIARPAHSRRDSRQSKHRRPVGSPEKGLSRSPSGGAFGTAGSGAGSLGGTSHGAGSYGGSHGAGSYGTGSYGGSFGACSTTNPESETESMWRVLPNSATIDNPTRVEAYGRWANVYPPNKRVNGVSWHSLKSPASLPITSESFTTLQRFREQYKFQFYDVAVDSEELGTAQLLNEMIELRLQMGFQIAVGPSIRAVEASLPRGNPHRVVSIVPRDCLGVRVYMTRIGLIHRLAVDEDRLINVRLYTWIERNPQRLSCALNSGRRDVVKVKTKYSDEYGSISKRFFDQGVERLNWSMLDQQVSGADDPLLYPSSANTQNLVTIRYVLLPADAKSIPGHESLTPEEGRVEGITRLVRSLLRHREGGSIDSEFIVHYYTGTITQAIQEVLSQSSSPLQANRLNKGISLGDLAGEMQGKMGLQFRDRRWHSKLFRSVFTGHDFVVWLAKTFEDIGTQEEAEAYGLDLMRRGLFRHPEDRHPFLQGHYFYVLTREYQRDEHRVRGKDAANASGANSAVSSSGSYVTNLGAANSSAHSMANSTGHSTSHSAGAASTASRSTVHVSESFVINVDPRHISGRSERAKISIDRLHNPKNAFHIIVEWLNVTPRLVDDLFSGLGRMVAQYGLKLVQVPITDVAGSIEHYPFRSTLELRLNIDVGSREEMHWFRHYVLLKSGYILDILDRRDLTHGDYQVEFMWGRLKTSLPQYIHRSGYVLVQMAEDDVWYVTANTLHVSRAAMNGGLGGGAGASASADGESELLIGELRALAADTSRLAKMLAEGRQARSQKAAPATVRTVSNSRTPTPTSTPTPPNE